MNDYNRINPDIGYTCIGKKELLPMLQNLKDCWIKVKTISNDCQGNKLEELLTSEFSFKVKTIETISEDDFVYIYGYKEDERLLIDLGKLSQSEYKADKSLHLIIVNDYLFMDLYISKFVPDLEVRGLLQEIVDSEENLVITEGKTDWKHLKAALKRFKRDKLYNDLDFQFLEYETGLEEKNENLGDKKLQGNATLKTVCIYNALFKNNKKKIFIFDSDQTDIVKDFSDERGYKYLGNNVYAIVIPDPSNKSSNNGFEIENYYDDKDIKTEDIDGRRLFLSKEFKFDDNVHKYYSRKMDSDRPYLIIDSDVYENLVSEPIKSKKELTDLINSNSEDIKKVITLSKNDFAENVLKEVGGFDKLNIVEFKKIFDIIEKILIEGFYSEDKIPDNQYVISDNSFIKEFNNYKELYIYTKLDYKKVVNDNSTTICFEMNRDNKEILEINIGNLKDGLYTIANISYGQKINSFIEDKLKDESNRIYAIFLNEKNECENMLEIFNGESFNVHGMKVLNS